MELKDKRIGFLGDSITEGHGVAEPQNIFWNRIAAQTGAKCFGYGIGGTRIAPQHDKTNEAWDRHFASRVDEMEEDLDVIVVFGGTNDYGHGDAPLGTPADRDDSTFYGAYHVLLQKLFARYPAAEIVIMTPLHRTGEENCTYNELGVRRQTNLEGYVDAVLKVATFYSVPVLDLFRAAGMNPIVPVQKELYMPDGLHPNDAGHARIAQRLIGFLQSL